MTDDERVAPGLLRRTRRAAGLTQVDVAARAGVGQPLIAAYEAGRRQPTVPMLAKLLRGCGAVLDVDARPASAPPDLERAGRALLLALDLAEHLPRRSERAPLRYPRLPAA